ncbi:MAG TPA: hypothetical protein VLV86_04250 [Vicinamibacterales bacterium]|nr:hypothetical protein [Vicinamibacterales bacterium]
MNQENIVLRKSLDAVDRHKWRMVLTVVLVSILTLVAFLRLGAAFRAGEDIARLLQLSVVAIVFWMSGLAFVIVVQLTVMTKRILRAIELAARDR